MRRAFSYINLLVFTGLFLILYGVAISIFFPCINKTLSNLEDLKMQNTVYRLLDLIWQDIVFAEKVKVFSNSIEYIQEGIDYQYQLLNNRLVRKKDGYVYLSPKEIKLEELLVSKVKENIYKIEIKTNRRVYNRLAKLKGCK